MVAGILQSTLGPSRLSDRPTREPAIVRLDRRLAHSRLPFRAHELAVSGMQQQISQNEDRAWSAAHITFPK